MSSSINNSNSIPFLDLVSPHVELEQELTAVFQQTLRTAGFIGGPVVQGFEKEFASFCSAKHCVGVASGTDALRFALTAAGVGPGDAVVTVPNTFIATTEAISQAGASPEFVDVDESTHTMCPRALRVYFERNCSKNAAGQMVSKRTGKVVRAVIPVHLFGQAADMDPILEIAETYGVVVIEDACQAHGAQYLSQKSNRWYTAGSMGKAAAFSFYPGKNLGACGEAGAITTDDEGVARICRMLRDHGQAQKYYHDMEGYNGRLDALQAGILQVKLRHLSQWNEQRRLAARRYDELFAGMEGVVFPIEPPYSKSVYHLYVIRVKNREELQKELGAAGIGTGIHYPVPLHLQKAYSCLGYKLGDFPVSEKLALEIVSLPMFPNLKEDDQRRVCAAIRNAVNASESTVISAY